MGTFLDKETNTHYNYYRDYDPSIGRYIESDPIGLSGGVNTYLYVNARPLRSLDPLGLLNVLVGAGFSGVAPTGAEASGGVVINPGWFGQEADVGAFGSAGAGVGVNVSADIFVGYVNGGIANVSGPTVNQNFVIGPISITIFHDPTTGDVIGGTFGVGPPSYLPVGYSGTYSHTGTWTLRDTLRAYRNLRNLFRKPLACTN